MKKISTRILGVALFIFLSNYSFCQSTRKISVYLTGQYTRTLYDITKGNNPWALGAGLQSFINTKHSLQPMLDVTADFYLYDDDVLRTRFVEATGNYKEITDVGSVVNIFVGGNLQPVKNVSLSLSAGPSFLSGITRFGIKPSVGVFVGKKQTFTASLSYINIFNRDKESGSDFGSFSFAIGVKLF